VGRLLRPARLQGRGGGPLIARRLAGSADWHWKALTPRLFDPNLDVFVLAHDLGATAPAVRVFLDVYAAAVAGQLRIEDNDHDDGLRVEYDGDDLTPHDVVVYLNILHRITELQAGHSATDLPLITTARSPDTPRIWDLGPLVWVHVEYRIGGRRGR